MTFKIFATVLLLLACPLAAQGTKADYQRANQLRETTGNKVVRVEVRPHWSANGDRFWYRRDLSGGHREFVRVDAVQRKRQVAFDHQRLARGLAKAASAEVNPKHLPFESVEFVADEALRFNAFGKGWRVDLESYEIVEADLLKDEERSNGSRPRRRRRGRSTEGRVTNAREGGQSPDDKWVAFVKDHNVWIRAKDGEVPDAVALTTEGTKDDGYSSRFYWSPDSTRLVALRRAGEQEHKVHLIESSPEDQLQPKLRSRQYLKPGDRISITKPHLFDIESKKEVALDDSLFSNPWRISELRWNPDSESFTFLYNQRGHQVLRVVGIDKDGGGRAVVDEQSKTFLDYAHKQFSHYIDGTSELIWMSERDGWNHLYLYDAVSGTVKNQITQGDWVVRGVSRVDDEKRQVWFRASGVYPGQDPYYIHHCRVNYDGSDFIVLTEGDGTHEIEYSPDGRFFLDTYSRVDMPPVTELRRTDNGKLICLLEESDWSKLIETGWRVPERFVAKARDGKTDIYGVIYRPKNLDPEKKYPVIEKIYAGPHGSFVPKSFRSYYRSQSMAELGFILVQIDGMGTSNRSKAFQDVCWKNLRDSGFPDRILWMQAAAEKYPYMDLSRVGLYGGSAGGQSTVAGLLFHPEFYKVGVADCGCHDNRMDKIWWNELWMGWPVDESYEQNSNVTHAHRLQGKLFLTVGELDTNVDPASTLQVVDALIKADKDFDFIMVPGAGHGVGESSYLNRRRQDFFVRHLLGVEPRSE